MNVEIVPKWRKSGSTEVLDAIVLGKYHGSFSSLRQSDCRLRRSWCALVVVLLRVEPSEERARESSPYRTKLRALVDADGI